MRLRIIILLIFKFQIINIQTFAAFGEPNNVRNAEAQTNSYYKDIINLEPYD